MKPEDTHVMLDLETFGVAENSVIVSIGAVCFTTLGELLGEFYIAISPESCTAVGLEMDAGTVMWWMAQSDEAREALSNGIPLQGALARFIHWLPQSNDFLLWGNGASFDNTILTNAYKKCGMLVPWNFRSNMCYRTLKKLYPEISKVTPVIAHNALDDAKAQAVHLCSILEAMKPADGVIG